MEFKDLELEDVYNASWDTGMQPNIILTTEAGAQWIMRKFHVNITMYKEDIVVHNDEFDEFDEWVKGVRQRAKEPKNKELRRFLGTNRWERR